MCTCPSRLLVHEDIYDKFIARVIERTAAIKMGLKDAYTQGIIDGAKISHGFNI